MLDRLRHVSNSLRGNKIERNFLEIAEPITRNTGMDVLTHTILMTKNKFMRTVKDTHHKNAIGGSGQL